MSPSSPAPKPDPADQPMPGLDTIRHEMDRQYADARASHAAALAPARPIAGQIAETGRLLMLGMGASHWANRMVLPAYRQAGIEAHAEVLSEHMRAPLPAAGRVTLIASQSGNSGEVAAWLRGPGERRDSYGLTLGADSVLGRSVPCLLGLGGPEQAYAATRSILLTLALHVAILAGLGSDAGPFLAALDRNNRLPPAADAALSPLVDCGTLILSSRGALHAAMEATALTFMELARTPAMALEIGQLLHGPVECLSPRTALVLARPAGPDAAAVTRVARDAVAYGLHPVVFDLGRHPPVDGATVIELPAVDGPAAVAHLLPAIQRLAIEAAALRVRDFGVPQRTAKVTDGEAA